MASSEARFVAGYIFTIGVAACAVLPRMPADIHCTIGGNLSSPFRRALLFLVLVTLWQWMLQVSFQAKSVWPRWASATNAVLGATHVMGQNFLCLATAYFLQCRLSEFIRIRPGQSLRPSLYAALILSILGVVLSQTVHANLWGLVNLSEALSGPPIIQTFRQYANVMTAGGGGGGGGTTTTTTQRRGPVLVQILIVMEYWYMMSSILSLLAEFLEKPRDSSSMANPMIAVRYNQESGINDWTRLLLHSIFLNLVDEMQHVRPPSSSSSSSSSRGGGGGGEDRNAKDDCERGTTQSSTLLQQRSNVMLLAAIPMGNH